MYTPLARTQKTGSATEIQVAWGQLLTYPDMHSTLKVYFIASYSNVADEKLWKLLYKETYLLILLRSKFNCVSLQNSNVALFPL
jgi:hypothetical protein